MAAQDVQGMLVRIEATTAQLRAEMKRADAAVGNATKGIDKQLAKVDGAFGRLETGAGKAASAIRTLAPALAGLATIDALRRTQQLGEEFTLLEARVKRLSGGTAEAAVTYARLAEVARNSGTSLGETVKLWESLTGTLQEMGATDAQVVRLTDTLQKIGTIGGSSAQEASNALRQLGQGLAGGVLRAEEFNSVIEGMPELAREIARGLGVPFGELRQLMLDGELTADKVLGAIQRRAYDVDAEFAKLPRTVSQASAALTNDLGRAISSLDSAIGGSRFLAKFLDTLAKGVRLTAGDLTDFERLNELVAERAQIQLRYEQAQRRTLLSDKERATFENSLKRLNAEIAEIQDRRIAQIKEEGREISTNAPVINEQYDKYLAKLKESAALQGVNSEVAKVRYAIEKGELGTLTEAQQASLLKYAAEKDAKIEAQKAGLDYSQSLKEQTKALQDLANKYDPAAKAQAEYEKGIALADKALRDGTYTTEQYQKVVQGLYTDLNKPIWDKHNKQADEAAAAIKKIDDQLESVRDRLDPVRAATKRLTAEKKLLKEGLDAGRLSFEEYTEGVALLEKEYDDNLRATSDWAQWTESALERVDSAFADAWRNIGDGFDGFRDSLTNAFKQMLAELAHMAITRPIVLQIGAALGIGGMAGQSSGLFGMLGGGSGGGMGGMLSSASNLYSLFQAGQGQGLLGSIFSGFQSGGVGGAFNGATSYFGNMFGGLDQGLGQIYGVLTNGAGATYAPLSYQAGVQGWGNMAATAAPWLAGGLGALMGYQNAGVKGAAAGAGGAAAGYYAGSALGSVVPGLGTAIGGAIGAALGGVLGGSLFGGKWQTKDVGIALGIESGALSAQEFEYQKKKGGLFSSNKKRTRYYDLDPETAAALGDAYAATADGVFDLFESLSFTIEDSALAGLDLAKTNISTMGKTEEEIQKAISEWFGEAAEAMSAELNRVFDTGLDLDLAGMQAFVNNLLGVNEVLRYLDVEMYDASVAGGKLAESLSAAAGGLDALAANSATYYGAFFSEAEKVEDTIDSITRAFEAADVELVGSREAYRAMVEDIDLTTEAGQEMFATLMALSGQAAQYFSIVEQQTAQGYIDAVGIAQNAFSRLQQSISAEVGQLQTQYQAAQASANGLLQLSRSLQSALRSMRMDSDAFDRMRRQQAQAQLSGALAFGRAGGDLSDLDMSDALSELGRDSAQFYGSFEEYARDYWKTANDIKSLDRLTGKQLSVEEKTLAALENQFAYFDQMLADARREMDILLGIDSSVLSVAHALANFQKATEVATNTPKPNSQSVASAYIEVLGRSGEADGLDYWTEQLASGAVTQAGLKAAMAQSALNFDSGSYTGAVSLADIELSKRNAAKYLGVPGFASGGFHAGGLRLVGENGPELEVTGPSRIYSASQTAAMLGGGGETASEVRALRSDFAGMMDALRSVAKHTMQTARRVEFLERWDFDGLPKERATA